MAATEQSRDVTIFLDLLIQVVDVDGMVQSYFCGGHVQAAYEKPH